MTKLSKLFLFIGLMGCVVFTDAQNTTSSPYSKYGVGTLLSQDFLQNFAMGGIGIGMRSNRNINFDNPASYSALGITAFEAGFTNTSLFLTDGTQSENLNYPHISHLAFGIPVMKNKWGMSFGMLPYSNLGYDYTNVVNDTLTGDVTYFQKGDGGLNKAYFGNSIQFNPKTNIDPVGLILKAFSGPRYSIKTDSTGTEIKVFNKRIDSLVVDRKTPISFGVNGYVMFGALNNDEKIIYGGLNNALNLWSIKRTSVADVGVDFGVQYQKSYTVYKGNDIDKYNIVLGATYAATNNLSSKYTESIRTFTGTSDFGTVKDTISLIDEAASIIELPTELGIGFSISKENKWSFGVDYRSANWGAIASNSSIYKYNNNYSIAAGLEVTPKYNAFKGYFKRVAYRLGLRYNTSYIMINNQDLPEYGIAFGMGLPLKREQTTVPQLNIGFEYGKRGQTGNDLIEETFYKINIGITINDRWFIKRRYD